MLRSQAGVEVEDPYGNLQKGIVKVKTPRDKPVDLAKLIELLENEVGFEPITEVTLELEGTLVRREGKLLFEASGTRQTFVVDQVEGQADGPPENKLLFVVASLPDIHSPGRIRVKQWKLQSKKSASLSSREKNSRKQNRSLGNEVLFLRDEFAT